MRGCACVRACVHVTTKVQELVELVFIIAHETIQSLSLAHAYQSLTFLSFSLFLSLSLSLSLFLSHMHAASHRPSKLADIKSDKSITDLNRLRVNFCWPHIDLYATQILHCGKVRLQQSAVVSDRGRDERLADLREGMRKVRVLRIEFRERSMGRFMQRDDRVAR